MIHDDCLSFSFAFNLMHKDHTVKAIIDLEKVIENIFQKWVHTLRTHNGSEFINRKLQTYCQERGISSSMFVTYNLELNVHAKRRNRTHIEGARMMLFW